MLGISSSWCHCHPQTPSSLASFKCRLVPVPVYPGCPGKEAVKRHKKNVTMEDKSEIVLSNGTVVNDKNSDVTYTRRAVPLRWLIEPR